MKKMISKVLSISLMCFVGSTFAHAADENSSKAEVAKQIQVCSKKKQGDWVVYANKGVTYNGSCQPNEHGKLQFTFPGPAGGSSAMSAPVAEQSSAPAVETAPAATSTAPAADETSQATDPSDAQTEAPVQAQ